MKEKKLIMLFLIAIILLVIIYFFFNSSSNIKLINANEVEDLLKDEKVFVLQVHTPYQGELEGTDLILEDWQNIDFYASQLPKNKEIPILVYCRSGRMSAISAQQIADLGYKNIYDFDGGMKSWETSGRKLIFK